MVGIVEFLNARLNEDVVIAFMGEEWSAEDWEAAAGSGIVATHIARHDPARVLREVTAKRAILNDELDNLKERDDETVLHGWNKQETAPQQSPIIRALASVYADHEDYDHGWV